MLRVDDIQSSNSSKIKPKYFGMLGFLGLAVAVAGSVWDRENEHVDTAAQTGGTEDRTMVSEFVLSADESRMFCRMSRKPIDVRDTRTGKTTASLDFHGKHPTSLSAASNGETLLVGYRGGSLVLWTVGAENKGYQSSVLTTDSTIFLLRDLVGFPSCCGRP